MTLSQLYEEVELHPEEYGKLVGLGIWRNKKEQAAMGQLPLDDNLPASMEQDAVHSKMMKHDGRMSNAKAAMRNAGIM